MLVMGFHFIGLYPEHVQVLFIVQAFLPNEMVDTSRIIKACKKLTEFWQFLTSSIQDVWNKQKPVRNVVWFFFIYYLKMDIKFIATFRNVL